jgi:hypothetical protein
MVYEVTNPKSQRISNITAMVSNILHRPLFLMDKSTRIFLTNDRQTDYRRNADAYIFSNSWLKRVPVTSALTDNE